MNGDRPGRRPETYEVAWVDTDASGHYHHATVVRWVEGALSALYDDLGLGARATFDRVVPVHYEVDYQSRVWFRDTVAVSLTVASVGTASVKVDFAVRCAGRDVASGRIVNVHLPGDTGSAPWPDDLRAAFDGLQGSAEG